MFAKAPKVSQFVFVLIIGILLTPIVSRGFSLERTQKYIQISKELKLSQDLQWIKLGHYAKTSFGFRSPFSIGFLISPDGKDDPQSELEATIELLYSEAEAFQKEFAEHPQCYYLARTRWLHQKLSVANEDRMDCKHREDWKKKLNAQSISLIFASADINNPASSFGHTFLKLNNPDNSQSMELIDYGIDYSADADESEGILYALKGLFGAYKGYFAMLPFHQKIIGYTNLEGRDIWEYRLNLSPEEVDFLVDHLIEMERARAPYYFFTNNCATQILKTIEVIRPDLDVSDQFDYFVIPIDTLKRLFSKDPGLLSYVNYRPSAKTKSKAALQNLNSKQLDVLVEMRKSSPIQELSGFSAIEKVQLIDATIQTLELDLSKAEVANVQKLKERRHQLLIQRSALKIQSEPIQFISYRPDHSHFSSAIGLGRGHQSTSLRFRSAFHELVQPHQGLIPFSHVEVGSISIIRSDLSGETFLESLTISKLANFNPWDRVHKDLSWKVNFSLNSKLNPDFEIGFGMTHGNDDADSFRLAALLNAEMKSLIDQSGEQSFDFYAGPEMIALFQLNSNLGLSFSAKPCHWNDQQCNEIYGFKGNINFLKNYDFQIHFQKESKDRFFRKDFPVSTKGISYQAHLMVNFLL